MCEQQLLRDENVKPTKKIIAEALGSANYAYESFVKELKNHGIQVDWRYYKDGNAWLGKGLYKWTTTRGNEKETTAFWLSVWEGFFRITIFISEKSREKALALPLNDQVLQMVKESKQIGKLKFFPLIFSLSKEDLFNEIFTLIDFRKLLK